MRNTAIKWGPRLVLPMIGLAILILLVFSIVRYLDIVSLGALSSEAQYGPPPAFSERYLDHPVLSVLHIGVGLLFVLFAPLQFNRTFRSKHLNIHRWTGRVLMLGGLAVAISGIIAAVDLPAFAGFSSLSGSWFFGVGMVFCLLRSFWCVRHRHIELHREWMIRAFAIALGVGTQRLLIFIFMALQVAPFEEVFGPTLFLGTAANLIVAETWINLTRKRAV